MDDQTANREGSSARRGKLRIAFSVLCGLACVLLIALWVRTLFACDNLRLDIANQGIVIFTSRQSGLGIGFIYRPQQTTAFRWQFDILSADTRPAIKYSGLRGFGYFSSAEEKVFFARAPYWALVLFAGAMSWALAIGIVWRFSLRTLFAAMTVVAVALGIIAALNERARVILQGQVPLSH